MTKQLLLATTNRGKQEEMASLFGHADLNLITPQELQLVLKVAETGKTYEENALLKAKAFCETSGLPVLADDSGLEVDALDGAPGLYSARFSPKPGASDADRRKLLVSRLNGFTQPWTARFRCTIALALPNGHTITRSGVCEGEITPIERGETGFGYDRIFLIKAANQTMAELGMEQKNRISHRAIAAQKMLEILPGLLD